ncbi:hypothetical protein GCM10010145_33700 [Streptomyces ruber]|uniref:Uncharacterized protein n=1 Tax=Streptomyces ruber TaxID=83378 RepID=A0A918BDG9_9ACTN|nr:hypothetical protein GCM10010145_33700 [Streptomyces ruber]
MPPKVTAGFARSAVSGISRLPSPPASTIPNTEGPPRMPPAPLRPVVLSGSASLMPRPDSLMPWPVPAATPAGTPWC